MPAKISDSDGRAAVAAWRADPAGAPRATRARAVRYTLQELALLYPGRAVEVRVPPFGAVQILKGTTHRRGTPPAVVEMNEATWMTLALGERAWADAVAAGDVAASGERTDLTDLLPLPFIG
ncbi:MAG: sterol carrier family protein [Actinomycetaceae bacterium]|nr:sterol carrier family protein [Actinomycetaceae bacterium]MDU0971124.1 sterol carrier family protein [Actinomycetaceae bacterium]